MAKNPSDKNQRSKFAEAAKEAGASEDAGDFDRALGGIAKSPHSKTVQGRKAQKSKKSAE